MSALAGLCFLTSGDRKPLFPHRPIKNFPILLSPGANQSIHPPSAGAIASCCHGATSQEPGLGSLHQKSTNLIIACVPLWVQRDCSKESKHATAAGGTSVQPVPGLKRRLCLFSFSPAHTQITNLPTPCSANASFCKQKLDALEGLTGLVQVDACKETPPFQGKTVATAATG